MRKPGTWRPVVLDEAKAHGWKWETASTVHGSISDQFTRGALTLSRKTSETNVPSKDAVAIPLDAPTAMKRFAVGDSLYGCDCGRLGGSGTNRRRSLPMRVSCADCGCLVDRGVIVAACANHPDCCCRDLQAGTPAALM